MWAKAMKNFKTFATNLVHGLNLTHLAHMGLWPCGLFIKVSFLAALAFWPWPKKSTENYGEKNTPINIRDSKLRDPITSPIYGHIIIRNGPPFIMGPFVNFFKVRSFKAFATISFYILSTIYYIPSSTIRFCHFHYLTAF